MPAGELLIPVLDGAGGRAEVDTLLAQGKRINAVRRVRELTGLSLIDAKLLVDTLEWQSGLRLKPPSADRLPAEWRNALQEVTHRRWWALALIIVPAACLIAWFIPALHGWPRGALEGIWVLAYLGFYMDLAITYRRNRRAVRDHPQ